MDSSEVQLLKIENVWKIFGNNSNEGTRRNPK